jgi:hypothetical protein
VRKLAIALEIASLSAVFRDFSGSDRSEAAKIHLDPGHADQPTEFSHSLLEICTRTQDFGMSFMAGDSPSVI